MSQFKNMTGFRFGQLTVLSKSTEQPHKRLFWKCRCSCGKECVVSGVALRTGNTRSCGCLRVKTLQARTTHGKASWPEYETWISIKRRCGNKNYNRYRDYGGRGIRVCSRWINSFENFIKDMGRRPSKKYSIERVNNEGDYSPENCIWATCATQARNRRKSLPNVKIGNETLAVTDWLAKNKINYQTFRSRLRTGWDIIRALTEKPQPRN